jgi:hypothetical protein
MLTNSGSSILPAIPFAPLITFCFLENRRNVLQPLVGQPCPQAHLALRKQAAILQTVRSIALIKDGILYCSSIFGSRKPVRDFLQESRQHGEADFIDRPVAA